jgi:hypothetical protein
MLSLVPELLGPTTMGRDQRRILPVRYTYICQLPHDSIPWINVEISIANRHDRICKCKAKNTALQIYSYSLSSSPSSFVSLLRIEPSNASIETIRTSRARKGKWAMTYVLYLPNASLGMQIKGTASVGYQSRSSARKMTEV